jgi:nitroimidazol reductase NimA-like FMN-containing flavoprotein (pyridoxamine 5'-phosphate oxidase superfamily)
MFREMRRKKQQIPQAEAEAILRSATAGVMAVHGDDGYPYAVPVSHVFTGGKLYFHSAVDGHKLAGIRNNSKVSFCVISQDDVQPPALTTHYRSVIAFGVARVLTDPSEIQHAMELLAARFSPGYMDAARKAIQDDRERFVAVEVQIEHLTGKVATELMKSNPA